MPQPRRKTNETRGNEAKSESRAVHESSADVEQSWIYESDSSRPVLSPSASTEESMRSSIDRYRLLSGVSFS